MLILVTRVVGTKSCLALRACCAEVEQEKERDFQHGGEQVAVRPAHGTTLWDSADISVQLLFRFANKECPPDVTMAGKRTATTELTDRNWDQEDEPEEAGTWSAASREEMSKRRVRKAVRRSNAGSEGGTGAFAKFSGLTSKPASTPSVVFSLNPNASKPLAVSNSNGKTPSIPFSGFGTPQSSGPTGATNKPSPKYSPQYCTQLQTLNRSLLQWLQKHVDNNPICDLTPSFRDYEKHLKEIEAKYPPVSGAGVTSPDTAAGGNGSTGSATTDKQEPQSGNGLLSFKFSSTPQDKTESSGITIGQSSSFMTGTSTAPSPFSFSTSSSGATMFGGLNSTGNTSQESGFKFSTTSNTSSTAGAGFKFSFASKPSAPPTESSESKEEEEYVPPKPEVKEVKEDGAYYSIRCKLFYQKDGAYKDKGVGNLHLKKTTDDKTQMVVRADTSLGNILLNIMLFPTMPVSRQGKNNVALVCMPNPPLDEKTTPVPTPMLIRVKTAEDADELHKHLCDNKGSS